MKGTKMLYDCLVCLKQILTPKTRYQHMSCFVVFFQLNTLKGTEIMLMVPNFSIAHYSSLTL